eukprot:2977820-Alexandrium_andersonii.AAC.1
MPKQGSDATLATMSAFALGITSDEAVTASKGYHVSLKSYDVLYVPQGWVIAERSVTGPLAYGIRKSFVANTSMSQACYSAA